MKMMKPAFWSGVVSVFAMAIPLTNVMICQQQPVGNGFVNNLMPQPASLTVAQGQLVLSPQFAANSTGFTDARLGLAIRDALLQIKQRTGLEISLHDVAASNNAVLSVAVHGPGEAVQSVDEDESYSLTVTSTHVQLDAATVVGAMRGLETLLQLVQPAGENYVLPSVTIHDSPRFPWRGLMIDCGRHFEPVEVIKRTLDGMAAVKLNVFHWHLTEDQGFRIESKVFPKLTSMGSDGLFYTQKQVEEIVEYARARGIRVVPEFEMPGHSTAWLVAYPELASGRAPTGIRRQFGVSDFALDPTREETYRFIDRFLSEMATLFPDPYLHIGGDETVSPEWKTDPRIRAFMTAHQLKDPDALQAYFNQRVLKILTRLHRHMIGWDEILNPALPKDVIVQSWRGQESLAKGAREGYQGLLSAGYYLDGMQPAGKHYLVDPSPSNTELTPDQRKLILGGEVAMWGEQINDHTIDSRIWPRTAAIAERFWSPENVTDVDDMYRRLDYISVQLEALGLQHISQEDASLRDLAGTETIEQLRIFASVLEPVSFGERYQQQHTSQLTVLDRFVDAVRPDPPSRYKIERLTRDFLLAPREDSADRQQLEGLFHGMLATVPIVKQQMAVSPRLSEVQTRVEQLPRLAQAGLEAISYLSSGKKAAAGWKQSKLSMIDDAKKPAGIVRFTFLDSLTALVNAVSE
ncbi:beta-N-acetylhexosaminidase [Granulicella arctica]|uniref:Hexosaminidase n=1 Tax=Granulicella arctica TaxID=940613 RepID=A0A7Y9PIF3_9BACT|nr:family 20 glycosylhydrolase [Granulicella arctica]NYF80498.1 hexosaminidase [Granulicella arctica]